MTGHVWNCGAFKSLAWLSRILSGSDVLFGLVLIVINMYYFLFLSLSTQFIYDRQDEGQSSEWEGLPCLAKALFFVEIWGSGVKPHIFNVRVSAGAHGVEMKKSCVFGYEKIDYHCRVLQLLPPPICTHLPRVVRDGEKLGSVHI